jgi:hypothetical protein
MEAMTPATNAAVAIAARLFIMTRPLIRVAEFTHE